MNKVFSFNVRNIYKRIVLSVFAFIMLYLLSYILNPYSYEWKDYFGRTPLMLLSEWLITLLFCAFISEISIFFNSKLHQKLPWMKNPILRLIIETLLNVIAVIFFVWLQNTVLILMNVISEDELTSPENEIMMWHWTVVSIIVALILSAIHTGNYLIHNWKNSATEAATNKLLAAEHKQAATEAELQALKLQIDPHFVFNNLSVLSELILEDQQLGYNYAENFSKVYRYLLVNSKKNLITLDEEIKFLNAYLFLVKNRIGDGVVFELNIDPSTIHLQLPPLTLQLFIENALKHNQTIKSNPLKIKVTSTSDNELIVENSLLPLINKPNSSGIGLSNIMSRYSFLTERKPIFEKNGNSFFVKVPLI